MSAFITRCTRYRSVDAQIRVQNRLSRRMLMLAYSVTPSTFIQQIISAIKKGGSYVR
jgi:hypothetical protein